MDYLVRRGNGAPETRKIFTCACLAATKTNRIPEVEPILKIILHGDWETWIPTVESGGEMLFDSAPLMHATIEDDEFITWCLLNTQVEDDWQSWLLRFFTEKNYVGEPRWPDLSEKMGTMLREDLFDNLISP